MKSGFIGLGNLGRSIAGRLIEQGEELTVFNRTPEKAEGPFNEDFSGIYRLFSKEH